MTWESKSGIISCFEHEDAEISHQFRLSVPIKSSVYIITNGKLDLALNRQ